MSWSDRLGTCLVGRRRRVDGVGSFRERPASLKQIGVQPLLGMPSGDHRPREDTSPKPNESRRHETHHDGPAGIGRCRRGGPLGSGREEQGNKATVTTATRPGIEGRDDEQCADVPTPRQVAWSSDAWSVPRSVTGLSMRVDWLAVAGSAGLVRSVGAQRPKSKPFRGRHDATPSPHARELDSSPSTPGFNPAIAGRPRSTRRRPACEWARHRR